MYKINVLQYSRRHFALCGMRIRCSSTRAFSSYGFDQRIDLIVALKHDIQTLDQ